MKKNIYFLKLDHILGLIRFEKRISEEDIFLRHKTELEQLNLNNINLKVVLEDLTKDGYIVNDNNEYQITVKGENFIGGYTYQEELSRVEEKKKNRWEKWPKIIPIILTTIAISSAFYFNSVSIKKTEELKTKSQTIDSLLKIIFLKNDNVDSMKKNNPPPHLSAPITNH